jgi:membrane protease YdiL (CAAX protease family)
MNIKPLSFGKAAKYFVYYAFFLFLTTEFLLPFLIDLGVPTALSWFVSGGLVFISLFFHAIIEYVRERDTFDFPAMMKRFRFLPMNAGDWMWAIGGLITVGALTAGIMMIEESLIPGFAPSPQFMDMGPLAPGQKWFLIIWLPFFFFNIIGEEIMWRGYLLPRMEASMGSRAWIVNGALWTIFHFAFGWQMVIMLLPILFIQPYIVQRRGNTWIGVIMHGLMNGPSFIMISLGVLK